MKNLICTLHIGNGDFDSNIESMRAYSNKIGSDFYIIKESKINFFSPHFEKIQSQEKLEEYDRVLYLDRDIIVSPFAEDIFEKYNDENVFYAFDENSYPHLPQMDRDQDINQIIGSFEWPKNEYGKYKYFNSGVMLFSKKHKNIFKLNNIPANEVLFKYSDQTVLNYEINRDGFKWESISYMFNRMDLGLPDIKKERLSANFIHYAGPCLYGEKTTIMKSDYEELLKRVY